MLVLKTKINIHTIQIIIFLLSISLVLNFIPNLIFQGPPIVKYYGITFILLIYLKFRGFGFCISTLKRLFTHHKHLKYFTIVFLLLFAFEFFRYLINGGYSFFLFLILPILSFSFILFLSDLFYNSSSNKFEIFSKKYLKPYFILSNIIIIISILIFFALKIKLIEISSWANVNFYGTDFIQRQSTSNYQYYSNPFYVTIILPDYVKFKSFFGEFGSFAGWSYEPHLACFFLTPAFLMINHFMKNSIKKIILIITYVIFYILAFSITNITGFVFISFLYLILLIQHNIKKILLISISIIAVIILLISTQKELFNDAYSYVFIKTTTDNASNISTSETLNYLITPTSLFGNGIFVAPIIKQDIDFSKKARKLNSDNIGIIAFLFFTFIFVSFTVISLSKIFSANHISFLGFIGIYILFHSLKFPFHVFTYPFFILILFILSLNFKKQS